MTTDISPNADVIDVRDVIDRVEQLRQSLENDPFRGFDRDPAEIDSERAELSTLESVLGDLKDNGGDEQWQGDWYPVALIRDTYFREYAMDFADDIGAIPRNYSWPTSCIDWDQAARELRMDYSSVEYAGITYWYR